MTASADINALPVAALQSSRMRLELPATGGSMDPLIHAGDMLTIQCLPPDELQPGDVICFRADHGFIAHRMIKRDSSNPARVFEKGDAEGQGSWINSDQIAGRVECVNGRSLNSPHLVRSALRYARMERVLLSIGKYVPGAARCGAVWRSCKIRWLKRAQQKAAR